jgi:DNA-binding response OmpR family regulator
MDIEREDKPGRPARSAALACLLCCVSDDPSLLSTRLLVLESAGYRVIAFGARDFLNATLPPDLALILLCHTLREQHLVEVLWTIRHKRPGLRVFRLEGRGPTPKGLANITALPTSPAELVAALHATLGEPRVGGVFDRQA